jgi:hypothetical protein
MFERLFSDVAHYALFGPQICGLSDFFGACAKDDISFFVENSYTLNCGSGAQGGDGLGDIIKAVEQHALSHGSQEQFVSAFGRKDYFVHNLLPVGPDNEGGQGNKHRCADEQKQAKEPECERIGNIAQRCFLEVPLSCFPPLKAIFTEIAADSEGSIIIRMRRVRERHRRTGGHFQKC